MRRDRYCVQNYEYIAPTPRVSPRIPSEVEWGRNLTLI